MVKNQELNCANFSNFARFAVKICKQCLQTISASGEPPGRLGYDPQMKNPDTATATNPEEFYYAVIFDYANGPEKRKVRQYLSWVSVIDRHIGNSVGSG